MSRIISSQQVDWWSVHQFVAPTLERVGSWPMAGSPEWCALPDDDPKKIAAIYSAAEHWALRIETSQEAAAQASRDVSGSADWSSIAREIHRRNSAYIRRTVA